MPAEFDASAAAAAVRAFLGSQPAVELWEAGARVARLEAETSGYSITLGAQLVCHFWSPHANLVRRIVGWKAQSGNRLRLECLRMGQRQPQALVLCAAGDPSSGARAEFRQALLAAIGRDWPGWQLVPMPRTPQAASPWLRLVLRKQHALVVCVAIDEGTAAGILAQALVLAEQARQRWPRGHVAELRLVLPPGAERLVAQQRAGLAPPGDAPAIECFWLDRSAGQLNRAEWGGENKGNLEARLRRAPAPWPAPAAEAEDELLREIRERCPQATVERGLDGRRLYRVYGLEIARETSPAEGLIARHSFGYGREQTPLLESTRPQFLALLAELAAQRVAGGRRGDWLFRIQPEAWMEHLIHSDPTVLAATIDRRWVYRQVPACRPQERDVMDLLLVDHDGRLTVVELKADEDLGFPLQALDYWLLVRRHQLAGDFERLGYFPGVELSALPPRLWMVAPALRWHPHTETVTAWLGPEIEWTRIGINEDWRHGIQIVYRLTGAGRGAAVAARPA
ncbi:MAG TPA: hypothetical protein VN709_02350 [Terriglobales bacterium]|nr:hypothetical protein [Terriglobales bacterium]